MDLPVPLTILLLAVAWFGHAFLMTVALNWCYAQPIPRSFLKMSRAAVALLVFGFPIGIAVYVSRRSVLTDWNPILLIHLGCCIATALVYLPFISVVRAIRKSPAEVVKSESRIIDTTAELGDKPVGDGKHWRLACLPGNQVFAVEERTLTFRLPRLPVAWDGLTILHVTDVHLCGTPGRQFYQHVFDRVLEPGTPDILAITGDLIDSPHHHRWIIPMLGRLKWNVAAFAILGNHDLYYGAEQARRRVRRLGIRMLGNSWTQFEFRGEPMVVIGNETPWFRPAPVLTDVPTGPFRFCLSHTPDNFAWAQRHDIDLMLAGHVHGGQIRLPGIGPLFVPSRYSRRYDSGQFRFGPTLMSVSRGLSGREPLRYNCRPEITRIVLRCA